MIIKYINLWNCLLGPNERKKPLLIKADWNLQCTDFFVIIAYELGLKHLLLAIFHWLLLRRKNSWIFSLLVALLLWFPTGAIWKTLFCSKRRSENKRCRKICVRNKRCNIVDSSHHQESRVSLFLCGPLEVKSQGLPTPYHAVYWYWRIITLESPCNLLMMTGSFGICQLVFPTLLARIRTSLLVL